MDKKIQKWIKKNTYAPHHPQNVVPPIVSRYRVLKYKKKFGYSGTSKDD